MVISAIAHSPIVHLLSRFTESPAKVRTACCRASISAALIVTLAARGDAQVVRGTVRDQISGDQLPGVLVTLFAVDGTEVRSVLSNERGDYSIRAPQPGSYRIVAKRIGARRQVTELFQLGEGDTRLEELTIEPIAANLPEVAVAVRQFCGSNASEFPRVAALWDEVNAALSSTAVSARDSLFDVQIDRYTRSLEPRTLRVVSEKREQHRGQVSLPFATVAPESLSLNGYWRAAGDTTTFYGIDLDVLRSEHFLADHCLGLARPNGERPRQVGITFEPTPSRRVADIRGTLWLDSATYELTRLEYAYTRLPRIEHIDRVGGQFRFSRLANGAWTVTEWRIRMPQLTRYVERRAGRRDLGIVPSQSISLPTIHRIVETGGEVQLGETTVRGRSAAIEGIVVDSAGKPIASGSVALAGTDFATVTDTDGRFQMTQLPDGDYNVEVSDSASRRLGVPAAVATVGLLRGVTATLNMRAGNSAELMTRLCGGRPVSSGSSVLRLTLVDSREQAISGLLLRVRWTEYDVVNALPRVSAMQLEATTAKDGSALFCGLPAHVPIDVEQALGDEAAVHLLTRRNAVAGPVAIRLRREQ